MLWRNRDRDWAHRLGEARRLLDRGEPGLALVEVEAALALAPESEREGLQTTRLGLRAQLAEARLAIARALLESDGPIAEVESSLATAEALIDGADLRQEATRLRDENDRRVTRRREQTGEGEVQIARAFDPAEASVLRGVLEANGIYVRLVGQVPNSVWPLTVDGMGETRLMVATSQAERARAVLDSAEPDEERPAGGDSGDQERAGRHD